MLRRIILFILTNGLGTIVDTVVLWLFSTLIFDTYVGDYIISPIISFECAALCNFACSFYFIWAKRVEIKNRKTFFGKYIYYNLSVSGVFLIKMGLLLLCEHITGWDAWICNLVALMFSGCINYTMAELVIFKKKKSINRTQEQNGLEKKD